MKKIILGMVAAFALTTFGVARAEDAPAGDKPADGAKEKKKSGKKKEKKAEGDAAGGDKK